MLLRLRPQVALRLCGFETVTEMEMDTATVTVIETVMRIGERSRCLCSVADDEVAPVDCTVAVEGAVSGLPSLSADATAAAVSAKRHHTRAGLR